MTETMLVRAARAMCAKDGGSWNAASCMETLGGSEPEDMRQGYMDLARAALEAIREPDAAMVRAASESDADDGEGGTFGPVCDLLGFSGENKTRLVVAEALRKSVDAILSQSQEGK